MPRLKIAGARVTVAHVDDVPSLTSIESEAIVVADGRVPFFTLPRALLEGCRVILDCENALAPVRVEALGIRYLGIGC